jgi:hypothetical protein
MLLWKYRYADTVTVPDDVEGQEWKWEWEVEVDERISGYEYNLI